MNLLIVGGRIYPSLTKNIQEILWDSFPEVSATGFDNVDILNVLIKSKGKSYFRNINEILIFDTSIESLTEWDEMDELIRYLPNIRINLYTRYVKLVPKQLTKHNNFIVYSFEDDSINIDMVCKEMKFRWEKDLDS